MASDPARNERRASPGRPAESALPEAGHRPGEHPTVRRSGIVGPRVGIAIAAGLALAALTYVAVVAGIIG